MSAAVDRINELQRLIQEGKEPSMEDMAAAIHAIRIERGVSAETTAKKASVKKEIEAIDIAAIFGPPKGDVNGPA